MSAAGSLDGLGVMVGLEIHQQLATGKKLFCDCAPTEPDAHPVTFRRRLRPAKGELGEHDPAALFEGARARTVTYYANPDSSCLVEQDEEPPHGLDGDAKAAALVIASALKSRTYTELHTMRKTVVDGSNTTGFQRTILIAQGGSFAVYGSGNDATAGQATVRVQSICLEEDAAKILDAKDSAKGYGLERLGVPLVEVATEPFAVSDPRTVRSVALSLGRILRGTKAVARGLGTIRQDVNVSIASGNGTVVEVKGVQQLDQLAGVVTYEAQRQHGLVSISKRLQQDCGPGEAHDASRDRKDMTPMFRKGCRSKIVQEALGRGESIMAVAFRGAGGIFGYSPHPDVRLGRDIAELVRLFGIGGIFHSDELPAYGITEQDVAGVAEQLNIEQDSDAFLILAAPRQKIHAVVDQIVARISQIAAGGIPADTRLATPDGKTAFLRPRPGSARMYPETDIPTITVTQEETDLAASNTPRPWHETVSDLQARHGVNAQLAEQLWDSAYLDLFEKIAATHAASTTFAASVLCSMITGLERRQNGLDSGLLSDDMILEVFELLGRKEIAKESVEIIFQRIMAGESETVTEAIESASMRSMGTEELEGAINVIIRDNMEMITNQGERAAGPLMGIAMKKIRGRAPGQTINALVVSGIARVLADKKDARR